MHLYEKLLEKHKCIKCSSFTFFLELTELPFYLLKSVFYILEILLLGMFKM